jgi:outer membrane protein TolC
MIVKAIQLLLEAEVELAETRAERIAVHEKILANLCQVEKAAQMRCSAGRAPIAESLEAKAARLKAEIQLKREQAGELETASRGGTAETASAVAGLSTQSSH